MEQSRHLLPLSFEPHNLSLQESSGLERTRRPLSDSAGNSQLHTLASVGNYYDSKPTQRRVDRPMYAMPTLPSQPARQPLSYTLEHRRQATRKRRQQRHGRNPIVDSPQYQAYRERQNREGNVDEQKWPAILEDAFLDALLEIPAMGRRKFSFKGKAHGRNELIKEYLWIAYLQSLPPGTRPDPSMQRTRKQVSSHIQVLKGFLREHPAYDRLFPPKQGPKNGFEDSFKNDPCLKALCEGRLPNKQYTHYERPNEVVVANHNAPLRPTLFWLLITTIQVPDEDGRYSTEEDLYNAGLVAHKFSGLSAQRSRASLDAIPNWPQKFPAVDQLHVSGGIDCEIIHMDVALNLMTDHPSEGSELCCRTELSIPGRHQESCDWRIVTTFIKPPELCCDPAMDPPLDAIEFQVGVISTSDSETRIKVPFPAGAWANAFTQLINLQTRYEEKMKAQSYGANGSLPPKSVRDYVGELSMYQEIRSSVGPRMPYVRRAIILWTFHKARQGEGIVTEWRYIDPLPARRLLMSPSPRSSHSVSAAVNDNLGTWVDPNMHLQHSNLLDQFTGQGLVTPPQTADLHTTFASQTFPYSAMPFDMPSERISFISTKTIESESTIVEPDPSSQIEHFITNDNLHLGDYDQHSGNWQLAPSESFDSDPAWANYNVPPGASHISWDADPKNHTWPDVPETKAICWADNGLT